MNIEKADYGTVIEFGNMQDLEYKLQLEGKTLDDVINYVDRNGVSLLEKSLIAGKLDIARVLLDKNARVNVVSKEGYNELHCFAANMRCDDAIAVARILLERGTSLEVKDKKYGNSALFTLCYELFKVRSEEAMKFLEECLAKTDKYDDCNKAGFTVRRMINENGTDRMKQILEAAQ